MKLPKLHPSPPMLEGMLVKKLILCRLMRFAMAGAVVVGAGAARADWPMDQPIRIVVPQAAGGSNDTVARMLGVALGKALGQTVVVENRPGAAGSIGMQAVVQSRADGYTLAIASDSATLLGVVNTNVPWDFSRDLVGVAMIGDQPVGVAVSGRAPYKGFKELIDAARSKPGAIAYGTSGTGSSQHIIGEWLSKLAGVSLIHVPYKGGGQAVTDLVGGQVPMAVLGYAPLAPQARAGAIRIVAITSPTRNPALPGVPTLAELGYPDIAQNQWVGVVAPRGTPAPVIERLSSEIRKIVAQRDFQAKLLEIGFDARFMGSDQFEPFLLHAVATWRKLVPSLSLQLN